MKSLCSERDCSFIVLVCFITDCEIFRLFLHYTSMLLHTSNFRKVYMKLVQENGVDSLFLSQITCSCVACWNSLTLAKRMVD